MVIGTDDINALVNCWSNLFSIIIEKHAPMVEMRYAEKYCPWIDKDFRDLICSRGKLKAAIKSKSPILMDSYKQIRNKVTTLDIQLKQQHYTNRISVCKGNMKESWQLINELHHKRSKSNNIGCLKESATESVHKQYFSNVMNDFFYSIVGGSVSSSIPCTCRLLVGLCLSPFSWPMKMATTMANQETTRARHAG